MIHRVTRWWFVALSCAALAFAPRMSDAQDRPRMPRLPAELDPEFWVGLSYGFVDGVTLTDGATGNLWQFGYAPQLRATFEARLQHGITGGVSAAYASAPLTILGTAQSDPTTSCASGCTATGDITQYLLFVRGGTGVGFHGTYNLDAGATTFSNFRQKESNVTLGPGSTRYDFTFGFGGGLGYGLSRTTDVYVTEQTDLVLHSQGTGHTTGEAPRLYTFVAGARIGF